MKLRFAISFLVAVLMAVAILSAAPQAGSGAEKQLAAAIHTEEVKGDLKGAIEQYKKLAQSANRAVAASALVRMGQCYEKLGEAQAAEARKAYERVVREYSDQKEAVALARARLGGTAPAARAKGDRAVWTGPNVDLFGTVSPDGRFLTYVDWDTGNLMLHDFATGADRALTNNVSPFQFGEAVYSAISRDGKQVAYEWLSRERRNGPREKQRFVLCLASLQGTGVPESRVIFDNEDVRGIAPRDWSPDGKWLAVVVRRQDQTRQIGLLSLADSSLRVLKTTDWRDTEHLFFSPDGRYLSYDLAVNDNTDDRNVFIMAVDGGHEVTAVGHRSVNTVMGWSPDGKYLLFASNRTGAAALWVLPVVNGAPQAAPKLVKSDIGSNFSLGLSASGTLYVFKDADSYYVQVAPIDLGAGELLPSSKDAFQRFIGSGGSPQWSPDGKYLSYRSCSRNTPCKIGIASMPTGEVRELRPKMSFLGQPAWSGDGRWLLTDGSDLRERRGLYRIDPQNGEIFPMMVPRPGEIPKWSPDMKKIYYRRAGGIIERDFESGQEREIFQPRAKGNTIAFSVSPDGRFLVASEGAKSGSNLLLIPVDGSEPRELMRANNPYTLNGWRMAWTPDHAAALVARRSPNSQELWLIPVNSDPPRKLGIDANNWGADYSLSPDGRHIAFVATAGKTGKRGAEIWALENFLPPGW